jgi:putative sugar-binding domain-containing protein
MAKAVNRKPLDPDSDDKDTHTSSNTAANPNTHHETDTPVTPHNTDSTHAQPGKQSDGTPADKKRHGASSTPPPEADGYSMASLKDNHLSGLICTMLTEGLDTAEIREVLRNKHKIWISPNAVYRHFKKEAKRGRFSYNPPAHEALRTDVMKCFPGLHVEVVDTTDTKAVTKRGAEMLGLIVKETRAEKLAKGEEGSVHMGLSGGQTLRLLSEHFSEHLVQTYGNLDGKLPKDFPPELHLHALVAGLDVRDPTIEPNAMFTHLHLTNRVPIEMKFVGWSSPLAVTPEAYDLMMRVPSTETSIREAQKIDIVVTGMGVWEDSNCILHRCMSPSPKAMEQLRKAGVRGDLMCQPICKDGPILKPTAIQTMTALKLLDLSRLIHKKGKVLLAVGPCQSGKTKAEVLRLILSFKTKLVTHLVLDSKTAKELVEKPC